MRHELTRKGLPKATRRAVAALVMTTALSLPGAAAFAEDSALRVSEAGGGTAGSVVERPLQAAITREGVRLAQSLGSPAATGPQARSWAARHPVIVGTLIGTAGGAVLSQTSAIGGVNHDPRVTLIGTATGAWGGLIASAIQKARAGEPVGRGTKIAIVAGAVSLVVLPLVTCYAAGGCGGVS